MSSCAVSQAQISVLLVDDDARFRQGLHTLLEFYSANSSTQLVVVGEAVSSEQALQLVEEQNPALILLDMELANGTGLEVLEQLAELSHRAKVLVLSGHREDEWVFRAMRSGANGYVVKDDLVTQLGAAITAVLSHQTYLAPEVTTSFFHMFRFYAGQTIEPRTTLHLTERELEVLQWLVHGDSNDEIAARLFISVATVKAHLTAVFHKLGVGSRTQAIIRALKLGLVSC
jgi:DNA-binding NarL/FixJ family response regulator